MSSLISGIKELELTYARANQHDMSCWEQCVDVLCSVCIDCGAETMLTLDDHHNTVSFIEHQGTQFICPTPHPNNPFWGRREVIPNAPSSDRNGRAEGSR